MNIQTKANISREEYGLAYQRSYSITVRFLVSRGVSRDTALETAQHAWTKGWERRSQVRDPSCLLSWINAIALNLYRRFSRREARCQPLPVIAVPPQLNVAALDASCILEACRPAERALLRLRYLEGRNIRDIALAHCCKETTMRVRLVRARRSARVIVGILPGREQSYAPVSAKQAVKVNATVPAWP